MLAALATAAVAGASECADAYDENCLTSRCCQDEGYRCFKREGREYAQCRRYAAPCTTQRDVWLCPEEWCPGCWDSAATLPSPRPATASGSWTAHGTVRKRVDINSNCPLPRWENATMDTLARREGYKINDTDIAAVPWVRRTSAAPACTTVSLVEQHSSAPCMPEISFGCNAKGTTASLPGTACSKVLSPVVVNRWLTRNDCANAVAPDT